MIVIVRTLIKVKTAIELDQIFLPSINHVVADFKKFFFFIYLTALS